MGLGINQIDLRGVWCREVVIVWKDSMKLKTSLNNA